MLHQILIFAVILVTIGWQTVAAQSGALTVAWVENGNLMVWHQGDDSPTKIASGDIQREFIAPDGQHIAFTRSAYHPSESLWVVGHPEKRLVTPDMIAGNMIAQVGWLDSATLYFNTAQQTDVGQVLSDDFWRVDLTDEKVDRLYDPGEGGNFTFNPNDDAIALVYSGEYEGQRSQISVSNLLGFYRYTVLNFPAVSTGSEYRFYPSLFWETDGSAFYVALPDKDLIYNDSTGMTALWRISAFGAQKHLGTVQASFFGQPQWSFDGQFIVYMRRVGDAADNQFELLTASGDGSQSTVYTTGEAGTLQFLGWLPNSHQFLYAQGEQGSYWLGTPGESPQALPGKLFAPQFVTDSLYVYIDLSVNPLEIRYADLQHPGESTLIATIDTFSQFSAVFSP